MMLALYLSLVDDEEKKKQIEELYKSNKQTMYFIARNRLCNPQDAEDAVHEAFLIAIKKSKKIFSVPADKRTAYLNVIVKHAAYDIYRQKKPEIPIDEDTIATNEILPDDEVISNMEYEHLSRLVNGLPDGQRDVMFLKYRLGLTTKEIAVSLSISEEAVRNRVFYARKALKEKIKKDSH